jgi:ankyrin repeat protein
MRNNYLFLFILVISLLSSCSFSSEKDKWLKETPKLKYSEKREIEVWGEILRSQNPALFYGTPLYDLAKEMAAFSWFRSDQKVEDLIKEIPKGYINYQEEKYGMTIGHFALIVGNLRAVRLLLDKGLNPNIISKEGSAIIIDINSPFYSHLVGGLETLKYMIKKGANVNLYSKNYMSTTPLIHASRWNFKNVKVLIAAGANPHFTHVIDWGKIGTSLESPLSEALDYGKIDIVNYLIFEQKVDFRILKEPKHSKFHPNDNIILYELREMTFDLNSKEYQEKMKLVSYLKTQGLDYWNTPIPEGIKNSSRTKEYLNEY